MLLIITFWLTCGERIPKFTCVSRMSSLLVSMRNLAEKNSQYGDQIITIFRLSKNCLTVLSWKYLKNNCFTLRGKMVLCYLKYHFRQYICGGEHWHARRPVLFFFKACVRYFLRNFYFSPNDSSSKTLKDVFYFI